MPLINDPILEKRLAALPLATYQPGEAVLAAGSKTGCLLFLKSGAVKISKDGIEIAKVVEPGAVFGEISALLDQPHSAEVRAVENSEFHVADAATVMQDPVSLLYVAKIIARRLDVTNQAFSELRSNLNKGQSADLIEKTIQAIETILSTGGPSLPDARVPDARATKLRFFGQR